MARAITNNGFKEKAESNSHNISEVDASSTNSLEDLRNLSYWEENRSQLEHRV